MELTISQSLILPLLSNVDPSGLHLHIVVVVKYTHQCTRHQCLPVDNRQWSIFEGKLSLSHSGEQMHRTQKSF